MNGLEKPANGGWDAHVQGQIILLPRTPDFSNANIQFISLRMASKTSWPRYSISGLLNLENEGTLRESSQKYLEMIGCLSRFKATL